MIIEVVAAALCVGFGAFIIGYLPARRWRRIAITLWGVLPVISYTIAWADWVSPTSIVIAIVFALPFALPWALMALIGYSRSRERMESRTAT